MLNLARIVAIVHGEFGTKRVPSLLIGPDPRAVAAAALDPDWTEDGLLESLLRSLPLYAERNGVALRALVVRRARAVLLMELSLAGYLVSLIFIAGGAILG